jgi:hypothetical protein
VSAKLEIRNAHHAVRTKFINRKAVLVKDEKTETQEKSKSGYVFNAKQVSPNGKKES